MKKLLTSISLELSSMNSDISFVKTMSVYAYLIIGSSAMLIGLVIGLNN